MELLESEFRRVSSKHWLLAHNPNTTANVVQWQRVHQQSLTFVEPLQQTVSSLLFDTLAMSKNSGSHTVAILFKLLSMYFALLPISC